MIDWEINTFLFIDKNYTISVTGYINAFWLQQTQKLGHNLMNIHQEETDYVHQTADSIILI